MVADEIEISEIMNAVGKLKPKLSMGLDGDPSFILEGCCSTFAIVLKYIFDFPSRSE